MTEFEPRTPGIGIDHSTNQATTTALACTLSLTYLELGRAQA